MARYRVYVVLVGLLGFFACDDGFFERDEPNPGVYCDGTPKWPCKAGKVCDLDGGICIAAPGCMKSADCPNDRPICDGATCRACAGAGDDTECRNHSAATPRCDGQAHACVACLPMSGMQSGDCTTPTAPICGAGNTCRACQGPSECASLVCQADGSCADPAQVAYADNRGGACSGTHAGTLADPYCEIQTAIGSGKPVVHVAGSSIAYGALNITSGTISIVGPTSGMSAKITGDANPAVSIAGASTVVTLDAVEITGAFPGRTGIFCSNGSIGPTVAVLRSSINNLSGIGINATNCKVILDRDLIGPNNAGGGISLAGVQYNITNSMIVSNVSASAIGVYFGPGSSPVAGGGFRHNTVAGNGSLGALGGISCQQGGTSTLSIENSIVWNNSKAGSGAAATQLAGNCALSYSDIDDGTTPTGTGNRNLPPDFINTMATMPDYHLSGRSQNNLACCVDQIPTSPIDHDYDGRRRPQGSKYDIGAHEVPAP